LIWLCGCAFLGVGIWFHLSYQGYATLYPDHPGLSADVIFITIGALSLIISFFGCCGSWFENRCCLFIYFSLIILLFLSQFIVGALVFVFRGGIGRTLAMELKDGIVKHYNHTDRGGMIAPSVSAIWDKVQTDLHCCGVNSYEDWYNIESWPNQRWVPKSCCRPRYNLTSDLLEGSGSDDDFYDCRKKGDPKYWWHNGCAESLRLWFIQRLHVVGIVGIVIAFLQLFGLIISMLLYCTVKHRRSSETYKSYSPTVDSTIQRQSHAAYLDD
jgi:tetraspanin-9